MNKKVKTAFKKLLGSGRAWLTPTGFTDGLYDIFVEPLEELRETIKNIKLTHFPVTYTNENNIVNSEEMFDITDIDGKTLTERAQEVEKQWLTFSGTQTYKQLENILQKKGLPVYVIENIPQNYDTLGGMLIGNGFIATAQGKNDPINYVNGKHTFIIQSTNFYDETEYLNVVNLVVKIKAAHTACYFMPRYLLIEDIHEVMTVDDFQNLIINQFAS